MISRKILLIVMLIIFFTGIGSVVASSDVDADLSASGSDVSYSDNLAVNLASSKLSSSDSDLNDSDLEISSSDNLASEESDSSVSDLNSSDGSDLTGSDESKISDSDLTDSNESNGSDYNNQNVSNKTNSTKVSTTSAPQKIIIKDASYYNSSNSLIQKIISNAAAGSTIEFTGSFYKNLCLTINKPLNIISKSGTVINVTFNVPVFTINKGGSGTNISGFVINAAGSFVEAARASNIIVSNNKISTKRTAIVFNNVSSSKIQNNQFLSFVTAIHLSKSGGISISKNNFTPDVTTCTAIDMEDCKEKAGINILNNRFEGLINLWGSKAINVGKNVANLLIRGNLIKNWDSGVYLSSSTTNVTIYNNTISNNRDGVIVSGTVKDFSLKNNVVTGNLAHGVLFDEDYEGTKGSFALENNFFASNDFDLRSPGKVNVNIGQNFAFIRCTRILMKYTFKIKTRQNGNSYVFTVLDGRSGTGFSDLPDFDATLDVNGNKYNVNFRNGLAYLETQESAGSEPPLSVGDIKKVLQDWGPYELSSLDDINYYIQKYKQSFEPTNPSPASGGSSANGTNGSGSGSGGSGNGGSGYGVSEGSSTSVSPSSTSAGSVGASSADSSSAGGGVSSSGDSGSDSASNPDNTAVKTLSVDEETFRVAGVSGLLVLILLVIGLYYREDIQKMMK
ncbi:NosD domain-containing protein [uncultured Methanobrevibacter sp.]|uniref:NosD domain-containing protein n=1 Tax=uncultured Methanobrevibacter sp. TaxID=253161 RepID=UPI0026241E6A